MRIPTGGPPKSQGGGGPTPPPIPGRRGGPTPNPGESDEAPLTQGGDKEPLPIQQDKEEPPLDRGNREEPSPSRSRRAELPHNQEERRRDGGKQGRSAQDRPKQSIRRSHTSWELRMLDPSENPPQKRVRRSTRGTHISDNFCEITRESNMICPITCGCCNSLLDIRGKTHVVSHILRATRNILKNELIACFGLTAAITNKDKISEMKIVQTERNTDLYRTSLQYTVQGSIHGERYS